MERDVLGQFRLCLRWSVHAKLFLAWDWDGRCGRRKDERVVMDDDRFAVKVA